MDKTRAVVIGGSMAGLCAARVLSKHFDKVTVLDRDSFPEGAHERAGVPQSRHVHALLVRGRQELNLLFPGFDKMMLQEGAIEIDFGNDFAVLREWGWEQRHTSGMLTLFASRNLIEATVRRLLAGIPNVELETRATVTGLETTPTDSGTTVNAVEYVSSLGTGRTSLSADLVVDASGRGSKVLDWLKRLGISAPSETIVSAHTGYSSRWFNAPPAEHLPKEWWWKGLWLDVQLPSHTMAGVLFPVENNRWIVTLAGVSHNYPPSDEDAFTKALTQVRSPILEQAVRLAEPISPVYSYRRMENRFRHYEKWSTPINGFVAVGDSACAFNPIYGQGITTGTISAGVLDKCLSKIRVNDPALSTEFFKAQAKVQTNPWGLATGADFALPDTEGERPNGSRLVSNYISALFRSGIEDMTLRQEIGKVLQMVRPPSHFFAPPVAARVLRGTLRRWLKRNSVSAPISALPPGAVPTRQ